MKSLEKRTVTRIKLFPQRTPRGRDYTLFFPTVRGFIEVNTPNIAGFLEDICHATGDAYTVADLKSPQRPDLLARARQASCYGLRHSKLGLSYSEIGAIMGRDRTTVLHGCNLVDVAYQAWASSDHTA